MEPTEPEKKTVSLSRALAWLGLVTVLVLATLPFFADQRSEARTPTGEDLAGAVQAVRERFQEGDAVRVEPSWWTLPWQGLVEMGQTPGQSVESTRDWPFPSLLSSEDLDPVEAFGHRRLFVVAGFAREPELPMLLRGDGTDNQGEQVFESETVNVAVHELEQAKRLRTLSRDWEKLAVARRWAPGEALAPCPFKNEKHRCGRDGWLDVAPEPRVVARREVVWLFTHPGPDGTELELKWDGLPATGDRGATWLYVRVGPSLEAVRHGDGADVIVQTLIGDEVVDEVAVAPLVFDLQRRAISLAGRGEAVDVTFRIKTTNQSWRETMLEADVLDILPSALRNWATGIVE